MMKKLFLILILFISSLNFSAYAMDPELEIQKDGVLIHPHFVHKRLFRGAELANYTETGFAINGCDYPKLDYFQVLCDASYKPASSNQKLSVVKEVKLWDCGSNWGFRKNPTDTPDVENFRDQGKPLFISRQSIYANLIANYFSDIISEEMICGNRGEICIDSIVIRGSFYLKSQWDQKGRNAVVSDPESDHGDYNKQEIRQEFKGLPQQINVDVKLNEERKKSKKDPYDFIIAEQ